jgi:sporulation protein YlmC with PRC-barrel domain
MFLWLVIVRRFYSLDEIRDAMVVDSEGFVYGYVKNIHIIDSSVRLAIYTIFKMNEPVVDAEKLVSTLAKKVSLTGNEPLEILVSIARREGLDIPYIVAEKELEMLKGFVSIDEIQLIDIKRVSVDDMDTAVKVILLSTPREAVFRGLPVQVSSPTYRTEQILNKLVVSLSRGVIGICKDVVIAPKSLGFRVYRARSFKRVVNWMAFTAHIKRLGLREAYERLVEFRDPYKFSKLDLSLAKEVESILSDIRNKDRVLGTMQNFVEVEATNTEFEDILYSDVVKVGDIVIAK